MPEHNRASYRHPLWDYRSPATYFITICTAGRRCTFGKVIGPETQLAPLGRIVEREWLAGPSHRPYVEVLKHVIMPNHFHGLLRINSKYPKDASPTREARVKPSSLGAIVRGLKSAVTTAARKELHWTDEVWQPRYHDRIVRSAEEYARIVQYIEDNPTNWTLDRENRDQRGENDFYAWLESLPTDITEVM